MSSTLSSNNIDVSLNQSLSHYKKWVNKWKHVTVSDSSEYPKTILDAIKLYDKDVYSSVNALLEIGSILPVSTSTVERSFSKLKLKKKNYIRSSTYKD